MSQYKISEAVSGNYKEEYQNLQELRTLAVQAQCPIVRRGG